MEWPLNVPKVKSTRHPHGTENRRLIFAVPPHRVELTGAGDDMAAWHKPAGVVQLDRWADSAATGDHGCYVAPLGA